MNRLVLWPRKRRTLKLGDRGLPVTKLQERLQSLGYNVGSIDGIYGFLTEDAVCTLQREFGLKIDGIAGSQVMELLQEPTLVAGNAPYEIWGAIRGDFLPTTPVKLDTATEKLDGLLVYCFSLTENGDVTGEVSEIIYSLATSRQLRLVPVISNFHEDLYDKAPLEGLLRHDQARQKLLEVVRRLVVDTRIHGIAVDLQGVGMGYGRRFAALMKQVRKITSDYQKKMYMVFVPERAQNGSILPRVVDSRIWRTLPDRVILYTSWEHVVGTPGPKSGMRWLQTQIKRTRRHLPSWKLMAMVSTDAIAWRLEDNVREYRCFTYDEARRLAWQKQAKITRDMKENVSWFEFLGEEGRFRVWFENRDSIRLKLIWLKRQHLAGIVLIPIGGEDLRIWEIWGGG